MFFHASDDVNKLKNCERANRAGGLESFTCKTELGFALNHLLKTQIRYSSIIALRGIFMNVLFIFKEKFVNFSFDFSFAESNVKKATTVTPTAASTKVINNLIKGMIRKSTTYLKKL